MSDAADRLLSALMQLSREDRGTIASRLLETLEPTVDPEVEAAWAEEIRIRVEEVQSGRVKGVSWPEARERIMADSDD